MQMFPILPVLKRLTRASKGPPTDFFPRFPSSQPAANPAVTTVTGDTALSMGDRRVSEEAMDALRGAMGEWASSRGAQVALDFREIEDAQVAQDEHCRHCKHCQVLLRPRAAADDEGCCQRSGLDSRICLCESRLSACIQVTLLRYWRRRGSGSLLGTVSTRSARGVWRRGGRRSA